MEDALVAEIKMLVAISDSKRGAIGLVNWFTGSSLLCFFFCEGFVFTLLESKSYQDSSSFLAM